MGSSLSWEEALSLCSAMVAQLPGKPLFPHWCEPCFFEGAISPLTPELLLSAPLLSFPIVTRRGACLAVCSCVPGTLRLGAVLEGADRMEVAVIGAILSSLHSWSSQFRKTDIFILVCR